MSTETAVASRITEKWLLSPSRWELWTQRRGQIVFCLLTNAIAGSATLTAAVLMPITLTDLGWFAALAAMGMVEVELARQIERVRHRMDRAVHINLTSVWLFPGVLLLPPALFSVLAAVLHWHLYTRGWYRLKRVPPFRTLTAAAVLIVTGYAVRAALAAMGIGGVRDALDAGWVGAVAIGTGAGMYLVIDTILIIIALYTAGRGIQDLINGWPGNVLLELATLCLGALLAVIMLALPGLAPLVILPVFLLHRAVLVEQYESASRHDIKTGVWNMAGWHLMADRELARGYATFGLLMIDLDHFKRINDGHGHLAGDVVLRAVADTITATVRRRDTVGRFGGEEFVVLLPEMPPGTVRDVAERIRTAISRLEVTVLVAGQVRRIDGLAASIGIASYPGAGTAIEPLLQAADAALYRAKAAGRNRVVDTLS